MSVFKFNVYYKEILHTIKNLHNAIQLFGYLKTIHCTRILIYLMS